MVCLLARGDVKSASIIKKQALEKWACLHNLRDGSMQQIRTFYAPSSISTLWPSAITSAATARPPRALGGGVELRTTRLGKAVRTGASSSASGSLSLRLVPSTRGTSVSLLVLLLLVWLLVDGRRPSTGGPGARRRVLDGWRWGCGCGSGCPGGGCLARRGRDWRLSGGRDAIDHVPKLSRCAAYSGTAAAAAAAAAGLAVSTGVGAAALAAAAASAPFSAFFTIDLRLRRSRIHPNMEGMVDVVERGVKGKWG